ncbi:MAG: fibronectin type III domain-containing protein [Nitrospirota bacterium]
MDIINRILNSHRLYLLIAALILLINVQYSFGGEALLSWNANTEPDLAGYMVYYGTSSHNYIQVRGKGELTGLNTTYTIQNLTEGVTYYFAVTAFDTSGNESNYSNEVSKIIPDTTPPIISGINISNLTSNSVIIKWMTNEPTDTQIEYGTTTAYGSMTNLIAALATNHSQTLTGLAPSTIYHYRVLSRDASNNISISGDAVFTTNSLLSELTTEEWGNSPTTNHPNTLEDTSIMLNAVNSSTSGQLNTYTWPVNTVANAIIMKWDLSAIPQNSIIESAQLLLYLNFFEGTGGDPLYDISVHKIINKNPIISKATGYTYDGINPWTPNTCCANSTPLAQADIIAPEDVQGIDKTFGYKSFNVRQMVQDWINVSSTNFGMLVNSDTAAAVDSNRFFGSNEHIDPNQRPKLIVTYISPDPSIGIIEPLVRSTKATIRWVTAKPATSQVEYGTDKNYGLFSTLDSTLVTNHTVILTGLAPGQTYHYRIRSIDINGKLSISQDNSFITHTLTNTNPPPVITGIGVDYVTSNEAAIRWVTDNSATSQIEYGLGPNYGLFSTLDSTLVTNHTVILTGLAPGQTYHYKIRSIDINGKLSISQDNSFITIIMAANVTPPVITEIPDAITDLRVIPDSSTRDSLILEWTATGSNGKQGTAAVYDLRMSMKKIVDDSITTLSGEVNFSNAISITGLPSPQAAGSIESVSISGLETNSVYYFAIKAIDDKGNISPISNIISGYDSPPRPVTAIRNGFTMVSFPLIPYTTDADTLLGDIVGRPVEIYRWFSSGLGLKNGKFKKETQILPGYGYFLNSSINNAVLNINGTEFIENSIAIQMQTGWNIIGNPYPVEIALKDTFIRKIDTGETKDFENAVISGWVGNAIYSFDGSVYDFNFYTDSVLRLWKGYFIHLSKDDGNYELIINRP